MLLLVRENVERGVGELRAQRFDGVAPDGVRRRQYDEPLRRQLLDGVYGDIGQSFRAYGEHGRVQGLRESRRKQAVGARLARGDDDGFGNAVGHAHFPELRRRAVPVVACDDAHRGVGRHDGVVEH